MVFGILFGIIVAEIPYVICMFVDENNTDVGDWCGGGLVLALMFVFGKIWRSIRGFTYWKKNVEKEEKAEVPKGEFRI